MTKLLLNEPVEIAARKHLGAAIRTALAAAYDGKCAMSGEPLEPDWQLDHIIPLAMGGKDEPSNWQPLNRGPHLEKSRADVKAISKAKRIEAKHTGTAPPPLQKIKSRGFAKRWERA